MESVMILGAGPLQLPAIKKAKELGMYVIACDYNPAAEGLSFADESYFISTVDKEAVLKKAMERRPDYIITSTSDAPVRTAAYVSEKLGLPTDISYKNAVCATVKSAMRIRLAEHGVPIPAFYVCSGLNEFLSAVRSFQEGCIVKPSDSSASRGVVRVDPAFDTKALKSVYENCRLYSKNGIVMVEEFMSGPEVSVESFIIDGRADTIAITDKLVTELPYFVELGHSEPSMLSDEIKEQICEVTEMAIEAIGIVNGVSHTELKVTPDGPKVVEIAARLGGDFITSRLVPLSTGVDMVGNSLLLALHRPVCLDRTKNCGSAIRFLTGRKGILREINMLGNPLEIPGVLEVKLYVKPGDAVNDVRSSSDRAGHVIAVGATAEEAVKAAEEAVRCVKLEIEFE